MAKAEYEKWLEPDNLLLLEKWARDCSTDEQIMAKIGEHRSGKYKNKPLASSTYYKWINEHSEIAEALKKGKEVANAKIEKAMISTMQKHTVTTTTYVMVKKSEFVLKAERLKFINLFKLEHPEATKDEIIIAAAEHEQKIQYERIPQRQIVTEVDPNVTSMIFWLKAREPELFRDQTFKKLNEANARKAIAEAGISEAQLKSLQEEDNPDNRTVIVDDISKVKELRDHANSTDKQGD